MRIPLTPRAVTIRGGDASILYPCDPGCTNLECQALEVEIAGRVLCGGVVILGRP